MTDEIQTFDTEFDGMNMGFEGGVESAPLLANAQEVVPEPEQQQPVVEGTALLSSASARNSIIEPSLPADESVVEFVSGRGRQNDDMQDSKSIGMQPFPDIDTPEMYPPGYAPPSLVDAAREAGIRDAEAVAAKCIRKAQMDKNAGLYDKYELDVEDAASILMYTADRGGDLHAWSPYLVINEALESRNPQLLFSCRHLIWKLLVALRKLPRVYGKSLFRGVTKELRYSKGETVCWHRFTSTTLDLAVTKNFMAMASGSQGEAKGTIFLMYSHECWGYDIRPFSFFPDEEELLLEPESLFTVESQSSVNSLIMCQLRLVPHPLLLENRIAVGAIGAESIRSAQTVDRNVREPTLRIVDGSIGYNCVHLQWDDVISTMPDELRSDAFYEVMVKEDASSASPKMLPRTKENEARILILLPDRRYQVKCRVNFGQNVTNWSQCTFKTKPIPALKLKVDHDTLTFDSFMVAWNDVVDRTVATQQEQQYLLQIAVGNNNFSNYSTDAGTPFKIEGLTDGQTCRVRVKLVLIDIDTGERVESIFSDVLEVRTFSMPVPQISVKNRSFSSMTVCWGTVNHAQMLPVGTPAGTYIVEWKTAKGSWTELFNGPNPSLDVKKLKPGSNYQFRARYAIPGKSGVFSNPFSASTTSIPTPTLDFDPVGDIARVSCRITNMETIQNAFTPADFERVRFEYRVSDNTLGGSSKSFALRKPNFSKSLSSLHEYEVMCRVSVDGVFGQWSAMKKLQMPESFIVHIIGKISTAIAAYAWELGLLIVLFGLLFCIGAHIDDGSTTGLQVMCVFMLVLFGTIFLLPIGVFKWNTKLPPLTGIFLLPLTNLSSPLRNSGANFYCVMLLLQYIGVMGSLVLLLLRTFGLESIGLFIISIPVCFAFTFVPAITLPALFFFTSKGRYELTAMYSFIFPFWAPLMMAAASIDGIMDFSNGVMFLTMYLAFAINCALLLYRVCCNNKLEGDKGDVLLPCIFVFGIIISLPTYLVMPILIGENFDPESEDKVLFQNVFAPIYIDIILASIVSIGSHCGDTFSIKNTAFVLRTLSKAMSPCRVMSKSDD